MKWLRHRLFDRAAVSTVAALILLCSGCAATDSASKTPRAELGQAPRGAAYRGQLVTIDPGMDRLTSYRPYLDPYEASAGTQLLQTRDAAAIMQAVLVRELGSAGYQPELASVRGRGGDELGIRYEVTRIRSTQGTPGMWPTPGFYRATVTTHVVVFRGDANCFMQSYFAYGEGTSVWSAFARAMDRSLGQSLPEVMNALSSCGTPAAETTE